MSMLFRDMQKDKYILMTKGADSIMLPRCELTKGMKEIVNKHLYQFACMGLRTLVMG